MISASFFCSISQDSLNTNYTLAKGFAPVLVIGATNRPDAIDSALRRAGS
jgi:SpoVK/Ycf46/Vps4 family AAA+-type ATPase